MLRMIFDIQFSAITILSMSLLYIIGLLLSFLFCVLCYMCMYLDLKVRMNFSQENLCLNGS